MSDEVKLIAYYLPQFHETIENNKFWGEGFTEWINVKAAKPLFRGHYQPRVPLNQDYYDLSNQEVLVHQMELAKNYGIYAFCFYHYWFHGKMILNKPVDNLLITPEGCLNYCISWANEPWVTTWHAGGGEYKVLVDQEYGDKEEWSDHFEYFLPFFQDKRYIKVNNKPMLLIYNIDQIPCRTSMFSLWEQKAKDNGFDGLYILSMKNSIKRRTKFKFVSGAVDFNPRIELEQDNRGNSLLSTWKRANGYKYSKIPIIKKYLHTKCDYDRLSRAALDSAKNKNEYRCLFTGYDETPRRREWSVVVTKASPTKFQYYLEQNIRKSQEEGKEYLFINAWNEWGEGAYLEPDVKYGYAYLQAVDKAIKNARILQAELVCERKKNHILLLNKVKKIIRKGYLRLGKYDMIEKAQNHVEQSDKMVRLLNRFLALKQSGKTVEIYFLRYNYNRVGIYGTGNLSKFLAEELRRTDIQVVAIVKEAAHTYEFPTVDVVVDTLITDFETVAGKIGESNGCEVVSLEDVVDDVYFVGRGE